MKSAALLALLLVSPSLFAGDYGLTVDPKGKHPCEYALLQSRNTCTPAAVSEDLKGYFIEKKPFRIESVKLAVWSGRISMDEGALPPFIDTIVEICKADAPHDFQKLVKFLGFLPYRSLVQRLAKELETEKRLEVRQRLMAAYSALPPKNVFRDYKLALDEAGDKGKCDEAVKRVTRKMSQDGRLSDADIQEEIDLWERVKGSMPYPTPGTACSIFGFQRAAHGALEDRRARRR